MKITKTIAILAILSLLFITACEDNGEVAGPSPYIGGTQGITAEFEPIGIEEAGVYTIYEDETFPIQVLVKNKGEEDVEEEELKVELYGVFLDDFSGIEGRELTNEERIDGITDINPTGDERIIDFGSDVQYTREIQGDFVPLDILASYTYNYKTKVTVPKVCFVEDLRDTDVCEVDGTKKSYSSAAPIQVNSVKESPAGAGKVSLSFEIENVGGGDATIPGEEFRTRYDQVQYRIVPASEAQRWKCTAAGRQDQARFSGNTATIVCKLTESLPEDAKYTKEIGLEIMYDYRDVIQESLRVKSIE